MRRKIAILLIVSILLTLSLAGCGKEAATAKIKFDASGVPLSVTSGVVAQNESYDIVWDDEEKSVAFVDKSNNETWSLTAAASEEPELDEFGLPIKANPMVSSAIAIKYVDSETLREVTANSHNGAVNGGRVSAEKIEKGIKVTYYFDEVEISIPVEYTVDGGSFKITVKTAEIAEADNKLTEVSVAPFICSVDNKAENSYLFVPSGSGALVYPKTLSSEGEAYRQEVYGNDKMVLVYNQVSLETEVKMPVYGVKNNNKALCAVIESGAEAAFIEATAGSTSYQYSSVYSSVRVRGYDYFRAQTYKGNIIETDYYSDDLSDTVFTVAYTPLYNEKADYNGMAEVYRSYLEKNCGLTARESLSDTFALTVSGGYIAQKSFLGIPYTSLETLTTIEQAQDIVNDFYLSSGEKSVVYLKGYGENGLDLGEIAGGYKINSNLGSVSKLNNFAEYCSENGIAAYFNFDMLRYSESGSGLTKMFNSAKNAVGKNYYPSDYSVSLRSLLPSREYALVSKALLSEQFEKLLKKTKKWEIEGFGFDSLGKITYSDYSSAEYYNKKNTEQQVQDCLDTVKKSGKNTAVCDANAYAAAVADRIFEAPLSSARFDIFDEDIPFYEIVFKGYVPMYSSSLNLSSSSEELLLAAIESGCFPMWSVIDHYENSGIDHNSGEIHNGVYDLLKEQILATVSETKAYYKKIATATITQHKLLDNGVRKTVFSNGVTVLVNRGNAAQQTEFGVIEAGEYKIGGIKE